ncbi:hypothetical protein FB451DRAFT_1454311 [Mycena latifolia]|nr:hypothetical protein FB451DRAFT_1454311 [Mycena latifolia]
MSSAKYELLPYDPEYELLPTGAAPTRRLRGARRAGICLCGTTANDTKTTAPVMDAHTAAVYGEAAVPVRRGPRGRQIRAMLMALPSSPRCSASSRASSSRVLNSTLILASEQSEHRYSTSQIFNGVQDAAALGMRNTCRMKDHLPQERRNALVHGWCAGEAAALSEIQRSQAEMADCTGMVDVDERDHGGPQQVRRRMGPHTPGTHDTTRAAPAAHAPTHAPRHRRRAHPRGDTGTPSTSPSHFRGSMNVPALVRVLADIRASQLAAHGVRLTIAMENAEARLLAELHETKYTLLDSGDVLAAQDILLLGKSSWMVHLVAPPELTVVEFSGGCIVGWYLDSLR